jgi:hypothetical protein
MVDDCKAVTWLNQWVGGGESAHSVILFIRPEHRNGAGFVKHHRLNTAGAGE